jgi:UTP--glucose-1-phosphate uridylyltransferase
MLPATKAVPKELLLVFDRPIIKHVLKEAISAGITEIILVTRSGKEAVENHFDGHCELEHRLEKKVKRLSWVRSKISFLSVLGRLPFGRVTHWG